MPTVTTTDDRLYQIAVQNNVQTVTASTAERAVGAAVVEYLHSRGERADISHYIERGRQGDWDCYDVALINGHVLDAVILDSRPLHPDRELVTSVRTQDGWQVVRREAITSWDFDIEDLYVPASELGCETGTAYQARLVERVTGELVEAIYGVAR